MGVEMNESQIDSTQRFYARLAGFMYLFNYATSVFGALTPSSIRGSGDFAEQAVWLMIVGIRQPRAPAPIGGLAAA